MGDDEEVARSVDPLRDPDLDPQLANEVAELVRKFVGDALGVDYVGLQVRYGLANELHRRGLLRQPFRVGDRVEALQTRESAGPYGVYDLVESAVVENQRIWILEPENAFDHEEKYSVFESHLRHARVAHADAPRQ